MGGTVFSYFEKLVEDRIQKAIEAGQFKDLPGEGKPLNLSDYDFLNPDVWMMNKILKNAGYLPPWVELAWDIEHDQKRLQQVEAGYASWLVTTRTALGPVSPGQRAERREREHAQFRYHLERYVRAAESLRDKIERFNAIVPIRVLVKVNIWVDYHVERMEEHFVAFCREAGWEPPALEPVTTTRKAERQTGRDLLRAHDVLDRVRDSADLRRMREQTTTPSKPVKGWRPSFRWSER